MDFKYRLLIRNFKKDKVVEVVPMMFMTKMGALEYADKHLYTLKENEQFVVVEVDNGK